MAKGEEGARANVAPLLPLLIAPNCEAEAARTWGDVGLTAPTTPRPRVYFASYCAVTPLGIAIARLGHSGSARAPRPGSGGPGPLSRPIRSMGARLAGLAAAVGQLAGSMLALAAKHEGPAAPK